jgi:glycosyltransferase involved in cell wall biosynthesis
VRLAALVESPDHVCCRYRLAAFRSSFESAGHALELRALPRGWWGRLRTGSDLGPADVVIVQRRLLPAWQLRLLRRRVRRLAFDFDDAVWLRDSYSPKGFDSFRRRRRFAAAVRAADLVVAGNRHLAEQAARFAEPANVCVIPTCVDPSRYPVAEHHRVGVDTQLVWVGSSSTLRGLEAARPILEAVGARLPGLTLKLVCDRFARFRGLTVLERPWTEAGEADEIAFADVGVAWVPDDPWSRGKCGLKVLQYMAAGLPVVANPVGVQAELVRSGETGFLATTPAEWAEAVARLARDPELRRRMGRAGRERVRRDYSVAAGAAAWLAALRRWDVRQSA